jgi:hypothetical protein
VAANAVGAATVIGEAIASTAVRLPGGKNGGVIATPPLFTRATSEALLPCAIRRNAPEAMRSGKRLPRMAAAIVIGLARSRACSGAVSVSTFSAGAATRCCR